MVNHLPIIFLFFVLLTTKCAQANELFVITPEFVPINQRFNITVFQIQHCKDDILFYEISNKSGTIIMKGQQQIIQNRLSNYLNFAFDGAEIQYDFKISCSGMPVSAFELYSGVDINSIFIESDKKAYREDEIVTFKFLPILKDGTEYTDKLKLVFQDPKHNKIEKNILISKSLHLKFYEYKFDLKETVDAEGIWSVKVFPYQSENIPSHHFEATFLVNKQSLESMLVSFKVEPTQIKYSANFTVVSIYSNSMPVHGKLEISIINADKSENVLITCLNFTGVFTEVDLFNQGPSVRYDSNIFKATVTDGNSHKIKYHTVSFNFDEDFYEIIPLRPFVPSEGKEIGVTLKTLNEYVMSGQREITVVLSCGDDDKFIESRPVERWGKTYSDIVFFSTTQKCDVFSVHGYTHQYGNKSRIYLPLVDNYKPILSLLDLKTRTNRLDVKLNVGSYHTIFFNDKFASSKQIWMIINENSALVRYEELDMNSEKKIIFEIDRRMIGQNQFIIFDPSNETFFDLQLFFVKDTCENNDKGVRIQKESIYINENVSFSIAGQNNGVVLVRASDHRLRIIGEKDENKRDTYWDLSHFSGTFNSKPSHKYLKAKAFNSFYHFFKTRCGNSKILEGKQKQHLNPFVRLSKDCVEAARFGYNKIKKPEVNKAGFGWLRKSKTSSKNTAVPSQSMINKQENGDSNSIQTNKGYVNEGVETNLMRYLFPEVWIFKEYELGDGSNISFKDLDIPPPHSVTTWVFDSYFWKHGDLRVCKGEKIAKVKVQKDYLIEMSEIPKIVRVKKEIRFPVTVHSLKGEGFPNMYLCYGNVSLNACGDHGSDDGINAVNNHFKVTTSNNQMYSKEVVVMFFKESLAENVTLELRQLTDEEIDMFSTFHCTQGKIIDSISVPVKVLSDLETYTLETGISLDPMNTIQRDLLYENVDKENAFKITETPQNYGVLETKIELLRNENVENVALILSRFSYLTDAVDQKTEQENSQNAYTEKFNIYEVINELAPRIYKKSFLDKMPNSSNRNAKEFLNKDPEIISALNDELKVLLAQLKKHYSCKNGECSFVKFLDEMYKFDSENFTEREDNDSLYYTILGTILLCDSSIDGEIYFSIPSLIKFATRVMRKGIIENVFVPHTEEKYANGENKKWFLKFLYLHMNSSCAKKIGQFDNLFYEFKAVIFDEFNEFKDPILTALVTSSSKVSEFLVNRDYWDNLINKSTTSQNAVPWFSTHFEDIQSHSVLSNEDTVLFNSLGLLSILNGLNNITNHKTLDPKDQVNWLMLQKKINRKDMLKSLTVLFQEKAIYQYLETVEHFSEEQQPEVEVSYQNTKLRFKRSGHSNILYLPKNITEVTLTSKGKGISFVTLKTVNLRNANTRAEIKSNFTVNLQQSQVDFMTGKISQKVCISIPADKSRKYIQVKQTPYDNYDIIKESIESDDTDVERISGVFKSQMAVQFRIELRDISVKKICYNINHSIISTRETSKSHISIELSDTDGVVLQKQWFDDIGNDTSEAKQISFMCMVDVNFCACTEAKSMSNVCPGILSDFAFQDWILEKIRIPNSFILSGQIESVEDITLNSQNFKQLRIHVNANTFCIDSSVTDLKVIIPKEAVCLDKYEPNKFIALLGKINSLHYTKTAHEAYYYVSPFDEIVVLQEGLNTRNITNLPKSCTASIL